MPRFDLSQYSTVAERIDKFWEKYPDGQITHGAGAFQCGAGGGEGRDFHPLR
jgi:hypothetical protein